MSTPFRFKKNSIDIDSLIQFLVDNEVSFTVPGIYGLPSDIVSMALSEVIELGSSDIIEKHKQWTWGNWELRGGNYEAADSNYWIRLKDLKEFWGDEDDIELLDSFINDSIRDELMEQEYSYRRKAGFTSSLKKACRERDGNLCVKCGYGTLLEIDHIVELVDGGDNSLENLQTLCRSCHLEKTKIHRDKRRTRKK